MNETKLTFQRYEKKYLLSAEQYASLWAELEPRLRPDEFYKSTVCSLYYDTDDYRLIRSSIERPVYKEKMRLRSYGVPDADSPVFVELKKKFGGIVYKRRVRTSESQAMGWLDRELPAPEDSQTCREIDWVLARYALSPKAYIACDRIAYVARDDGELRMTFDSGIRWRDDRLLLSAGTAGEELLADGQVLMEIKMPGSAPLWLAHMLSQARAFPTSFSKYGSCYKKDLLHKYFDGVMEIA